MAPMQSLPADTTPDRVPFSDGYFVVDWPEGTYELLPRPAGDRRRLRPHADRPPDVAEVGEHGQGAVVGPYAPLPKPPELDDRSSARTRCGTWKYTTSEPRPRGREASGFQRLVVEERRRRRLRPRRSPAAAAEDRLGHGRHLAAAKSVAVPAGNFADLDVHHCWHDEDVEIYVNGVLAATGARTTRTGVREPATVAPAGRAALKLGGPNEIAVHCHQTDRRAVRRRRAGQRDPTLNAGIEPDSVEAGVRGYARRPGSSVRTLGRRLPT